MAEERESLHEEIENHRQAITELQEKLRQVEASNQPVWPPQEFYFVYYVVAGLMIGVIGALASFFFNVIGSMMMSQDPMMLIRVFGTFFIGEKALTTLDLNFLMLVLMAHFSVGATGGAMYHVVMNKYFLNRSYEWKLLMGGGWGLIIWIVSFYLIISWAQPMRVGEAYILSMIPIWVAALTHLVYGLTLGVLEPMGRFVPYRTASKPGE